MAYAHGRDGSRRANQDGARLVRVKKRHVRTGDLRWRHVHDGLGIDIQALTDIAGNADNLSEAHLISRTQAGTDENGLANRIRARPEPTRHSPANDYSQARFLVMQQPAGEQGDL